MNAADANLMASHVFIFLLHTPTSTVRLPLYGATSPRTRGRSKSAVSVPKVRFRTTQPQTRWVLHRPCSGSGQHSHRHAGYCTVLGPSLTKCRSGQCPLLAPAAHEPDAASVCPVADLGAIPWAAYVGESRQCRIQCKPTTQLQLSHTDTAIWPKQRMLNTVQTWIRTAV